MIGKTTNGVQITKTKTGKIKLPQKKKNFLDCIELLTSKISTKSIIRLTIIGNSIEIEKKQSL
jgi:hypothetical protein